jgi:hypothetical protein
MSKALIWHYQMTSHLKATLEDDQQSAFMHVAAEMMSDKQDDYKNFIQSEPARVALFLDVRVRKPPVTSCEFFTNLEMMKGVLERKYAMGTYNARATEAAAILNPSSFAAYNNDINPVDDHGELDRFANVRLTKND